jgi:hypothetical protein
MFLQCRGQGERLSYKVAPEREIVGQVFRLSPILPPPFRSATRARHRQITAAPGKGINKKRPSMEADAFAANYWTGRLARSPITAAVAAATATAAAISATATATVAAATATATRRSCFTRTRFVHGKSATFHGFAIKLGNGILCFLFCRHGHKSEAARLACEFILHKHDILHSTSLREEILKVGFRRIERKIPNV